MGDKRMHCLSSYNTKDVGPVLGRTIALFPHIVGSPSRLVIQVAGACLAKKRLVDFDHRESFGKLAAGATVHSPTVVRIGPC
jgi:hypothetical protein